MMGQSDRSNRTPPLLTSELVAAQLKTGAILQCSPLRWKRACIDASKPSSPVQQLPHPHASNAGHHLHMQSCAAMHVCRHSQAYRRPKAGGSIQAGDSTTLCLLHIRWCVQYTLDPGSSTSLPLAEAFRTCELVVAQAEVGQLGQLGPGDRQGP